MKFVATFHCPNTECRRYGVTVRTDMTEKELKTAFSRPLECSACSTELVSDSGNDFYPCPCCFPGEVQS